MLDEGYLSRARASEEFSANSPPPLSAAYELLFGVTHDQAITIPQFDANTVAHFFGLLGRLRHYRQMPTGVPSGAVNTSSARSQMTFAVALDA